MAAIELRDADGNLVVEAATLAELMDMAKDFKAAKHTPAYKLLHRIRDAIAEGKTTKFEIGGVLLERGYRVKFS